MLGGTSMMRTILSAAALSALLAAPVAAQGTVVVVETGAQSPARARFFVRAATGAEGVFYASSTSHALARAPARHVRAAGVRAIERGTGCTVDRGSVRVEVFRSLTFGPYGARIDGRVSC